MTDHIRFAGDAVSIVALIAAIAGIIPWIASVFCLVWYAIQIYESKTVQGWLQRRNRQ